eukprot:TRINITY_DN5809_c0_g2_i2.p1 TRINITY_DN5809_c0_g2~~TRINITY_DN5809_c0_g2_i2.p1  ORF type:complete len:295 (-),score=72.41 TRINITY_DN5809_c0_g2_i2:25-909(-)
MSTKSDSLAKNALAGGAAGAIEVCIMYPTEYVKTQLQLSAGAKHGPRFAGPVDCARTIVRERGVFGLYRGLSTLIAGSIPKAAVRFAAFKEMSKRLKDDKGKLSTANTVLCGLVAGASEAIIAVAPAETLKTKLIHDQNQPNPKYKGFVHGLTTIVRTEGIRGVYQGVTATVLKQSGNQMVRFTVYETLKGYFLSGNSQKDLSFFQSLVCGSVAGGISVYVTMPLDVVKTKMQGLEAKNYRNTWHCFTSVVRNDGVLALWKGTTPRLARVGCSGAITFASFEQVMKLLNYLSPE